MKPQEENQTLIGYNEPDNDIIKEQPIDFSSKSKKEMQQFFKDNGIAFKDSRKYPIDEEIMQANCSWLDNFLKQNKGFNNNNAMKIPEINMLPPSKMKGGRIGGYYQAYIRKPEVVEMALGARDHSNTILFRNIYNAQIEKGWLSQNAELNRVFVHEYGHHVSNSIRWQLEDDKWESRFIAECLADFNKSENKQLKNYSFLREDLSIYGASSPSETFAEAFAEYYGGAPRAFAKIFGEKLEKILKEVFK